MASSLEPSRYSAVARRARPALRDPVTRLRRQLGLAAVVDDTTIAAALEEVSRFADPLARLQAALDSTLGHWLAMTQPDPADALAALVACAPRPSH